jgi:acyl-CoA synthetase (AMP-forming)/AMP-acid ligase II
VLVLLGELAHAAAQAHGGRCAYVVGDVSVTFAELDSRVRRCASGLARMGVGEGAVVAILQPSGLEHPVTYLAASLRGAVTAAVNPRLSPAERTRLLATAGPRLLVTAPELLDGVVVPSGCEVVAARDLESDGPVTAVTEQADRPVALVFTSGTTGLPKGAVFAGRQLDVIRRTDVGELWSRGGTQLAGTSMAHLGFMTKLGGALQSGSTSVVVTRWSASLAVELTRHHGLTTMAGVPTQLALVLDELEHSGGALPSLQQVLIGGGPASPALVRRARAVLGVPVCTRYSCTEAGIGLGTRPGDPDEDAELTVGRPQPGVEVRIVDGEVQLRSGAVMSGYWHDPLATDQALTPDGWVRTGDLGRLDDQGRLWLQGRSKEMYVRGGYNVYPVAVEAVLAGCPGVRQIAVVARPDETWGEVGVAVVVGEASLQQLREHGAAHLSKQELPTEVVHLAALPLTAGDKVDRRALADLVSSGVG